MIKKSTNQSKKEKTLTPSKSDLPKKRGRQEGDLQDNVIEYLRTLDDGQFYLTNVVASEKDSGMPDISGHLNGWYIAIELKRPDGKGRQSKEQKAFQSKCEKLGGKYILCTSLKQLKEELPV